MSEKVVQLKPKACGGLYEIKGVGKIVLDTIVGYGKMLRIPEVFRVLKEEKLIRAYFEASENANFLLRNFFAVPKHYNLDTIALKHDLVDEYSFSFFLSGTNRQLISPILSFHVGTSFQPREDQLAALRGLQAPEFPVVLSTEKARSFLKETGEPSMGVTTEQLNSLIMELDEFAKEFGFERFGFLSVGPDGKTKIMVLGFRYFDKAMVENSSIVGFDVGGKKVAALVEVRLEISLDFIEMDFMEVTE